MPRFFFHLHDDLDAEDPEGVELPCADAVPAYAWANAVSIICEHVRSGRVNLDHYLEVADERGQLVHTLKFRDAFVIEG
jgi:hypothetical protein